jgi:hypothetical protein
MSAAENTSARWSATGIDLIAPCRDGRRWKAW